jgi:hypothetical protein
VMAERGAYLSGQPGWTHPGYGGVSASHSTCATLGPGTPASGRVVGLRSRGEDIVSDQPPWGQPEYPPQQPYGQQPYGQQAYPPEQPTDGQQDPGQYQGQPRYRRTGQQPSRPSFTPNPQYGAPPGQPQYQGQPQYPPGSYGQQPYPQGQPPYGQQPYPGSGSGPQPPRRRRKRHLLRNTLAVIGGLIVAAIAISVASFHSGGVSTTPSGSSSTAGSASSPAPTAKRLRLPGSARTLMCKTAAATPTG